MDPQEHPLFVFEMANNHQGNVEHGKRIIHAMREVALPYADQFRFAVKFQYRDLDTFIHSEARGRGDIKNVKRFEDTRLSHREFAELLACVRENGMLAVCTPFDEVSVARIAEEGYDCVKIASCSFGDWPLMEAIAKTRLPIIASAAGCGMDLIQKVLAFFSHRKVPFFALMHCVGEYPTLPERLQLNQLDLFRREFPETLIGFSTHESPDKLDAIKIAVAKGARIFEKHVGIPFGMEDLNSYSANPEQVAAWLAAAHKAFAICGIEDERYAASEKETADLIALRRGIFVAGKNLEAGTELKDGNVYFAFPCWPDQLLAHDYSRYSRFTLNKPLVHNAPVMRNDVDLDDYRPMISGYLADIVALLGISRAVVPLNSTCELSHHYGVERFREVGLALIDCVNREYCKKLLVLLPGQRNPSHYHVRKEETFLILHGDLSIKCGNGMRVLGRGDTLTVERNSRHSFSTEKGCVFEEISSTHFVNDSFYDDKDAFVIPRKTTVFLTKDILPEFE